MKIVVIIVSASQREQGLCSVCTVVNVKGFTVNKTQFAQMTINSCSYQRVDIVYVRKSILIFFFFKSSFHFLLT